MNAIALALLALAQALPQGNTGIASQYANDAGIASHPAVLFHDDFENQTGISSLQQNWNAGVWQPGLVRIATEPGNFHGGSKAVEFTLPPSSTELGDACSRWISPTQDVVFLRFYAKYPSNFNVPVASRHDGGEISAGYFVGGMATPGVPANGTNKYLANFECFPWDTAVPTPGMLSIYIYWPEQFGNYGDNFFPSGTVIPNSYIRSGAATFGPTFVSRPDVVPPLGSWHCYEYMLQANTPGLRDGRIACWFDGNLIADFPNLRFRDIASLKIDHVAIGLFLGSNGQENKKWYDDVVVATSYIGPMTGTSTGGGGGGGGGGSSGGCSASHGASVPVVLIAIALLAIRRFV
jgi:hypothetical protein